MKPDLENVAIGDIIRLRLDITVYVTVIIKVNFPYVFNTKVLKTTKTQCTVQPVGTVFSHFLGIQLSYRIKKDTGRVIDDSLSKLPVITTEPITRMDILAFRSHINQINSAVSKGFNLYMAPKIIHNLDILPILAKYSEDYLKLVNKLEHDLKKANKNAQ